MRLDATVLGGRFGFLAGAAAVLATLSSVPAVAMEPWQIGHGPFVSASDVTNHNRMPLDIAEVNAALAAEPRDWEEALARFAFGGNFPNHSLALFTDDYNGRFDSHISEAVAYFGSPSFMNHHLLAALVGTGIYRRWSEDERAAFIEAGLQAVSLNWSRYELGESRRKATMAEPNWSLENGSPKNWNEIFAFYFGPDGAYSTFETMAAIDGGAELNDALIATLAEGQDILVAETWTEEHAAQIAAHLDRASLLMLSAALNTGNGGDTEALMLARARGLGAWLAEADTLGSDEAIIAAMSALRAADPETLANSLDNASSALEPHLLARD